MSPQRPGREIPVSEELFAPVSSDIELCYQTFGEPDGDPLLLVMGLGGPMIWWDEQLCTMLAESGFYVVRYDNRDTGRSTRPKHRVTKRQLVQAFVGGGTTAPYTMADLTRDAVGLLDHLGLPAAHVAGVSMGGMIAQTLAVEHPERVRSLTSIMSTTGKRTVGWQDPRLLPQALKRRATTREAYAESSARFWTLIGSPSWPQPDEAVRLRARDTWDRGVSGPSVMRQTLAILTQPDRTQALHGVTVPTTVVHGTADRMVHLSGGRATAAAVPAAELVVIDGMGHDLPEGLYSTFADTIRRTAERATT